jgi:ubiquinone/menaquinone biosynthesis C-methylase UbiE
MSATDKVFAGSIPEFYDTYMVPLIFQVYADDLAARVSEIRPSSVLETAAGTGVVTRALARRLDPAARYVASDLNHAMIDHAATRQPKDPAVEWRQADALDLPFAVEEFDVVLCQFGAMFFPDRSKGYVEARRVLRPSGRFVFSVWDRIENNDLAHIVTEAVATAFPENPPRFLARTPHGYFDRDLIRGDLERSGFSDIVIEHLEATSHVQSPDMAAKAYCQGTPLRNEIETRGPSMLEELTDRAAAAIEARFGEGPISSRISAFVVTATK